MSAVEDTWHDTCRCGEPSCFPELEQLSEMSAELSQKLFTDVEILNKIVTRHEAVIRRRWLKKGKTHRKDVLLTAWPDMPIAHRPDFTVYMDSEWKRAHGSTEARNSQRWPHMNLEDLMKPKILLIYVNARGRHPPHIFAHSEQKFAPLGCPDIDSLMKVFPTKFAVVFKGKTSPQDYGQWIEYKDIEQVMTQIRHGHAMHPGPAFQVMQIQQRIWSFLVKCCLQILHETSLEAHINTSNLIQPEPELLSENVESYSSFDTMASEAPYKVPGQLDISRMRSLLSAQRRECEDHIWALREDPSYFCETIHSAQQHAPELVPDYYGNEHPVLRKSCIILRQNKALERIIGDEYGAFIDWNELVTLSVELEVLSQTYPPRDYTSNKPSKDFVEVLEKLFVALINEYSNIKGKLRMSIHGCSRLSSFIERSPHRCKNRICDTCLELRLTNMEGDSVECRLMRLLSSLLSKNDAQNWGLWNITDAVQRFIQRNPSSQSIFTPFVESKLAQMSIVAECLRQLDLFPWMESIKVEMDRSEEKRKRESDERHQKWCGLACRMLTFNDPEFSRLANPADGKFNYPVHKRRTRENVETVRTAEASLDKFWNFVDMWYQKETEKSVNDICQHLLADGRTMQRTLPWVEDAEAETPNSRIRQEDYTYEPLSRMYHDRAKEFTGSFDKLAISANEKPKTRGAVVLDEGPALELPLELVPDNQPTFTLDKRSHKVFRTLFHSPNSPDQPGEIPWTEFLHAMVSTGFSVEKLHGSAWNFTPQDLDVERSIQFHEPHPSSKLPFTWARRIGRRLNRTYGWKGEMFRLA